MLRVANIALQEQTRRKAAGKAAVKKRQLA
jgi:hypothetical protein